jgi:uncharacterized membrane protein YeaQ/YmgE (transglycosylase-associated protein family)
MLAAGMQPGEFLVLCYHNIAPGWWSYLSKVLIGWVGARLGSPVFGHWWQGLNYKEVYIVPAILGCLLLLIFAVDFIKTCATISKGKAEPPMIKGSCLHF